MDILFKRPDGTFVIAWPNGIGYHVTPEDPLFAEAQTVAAGMGPALQFEPAPTAPTEAERLAQARAVARIDRGPLCLALYGAGILSGPSALEAAKGNWPSEFEAFLTGLSATEQLGAQIAWADATAVRYENPLLQETALAYCSNDATAATALLDSLFDVT